VSYLIPLDSGVIGLLCSSPLIPEAAACRAWLASSETSGRVIVIPAITLYELRLETLCNSTRSAEVTPEAWLKAAEFWALVRSAGKPTADPHALDGDAILAGVAATIGTLGDLVTIATSNVGHLSRFPGVDARRWELIS
jgi:hypothetical protein